MAEVAARVWPGPAAPVRRAEDEAKATPSRFETRLRFWDGFREHIQASGSPLKPGKPQPHYSLACGRLAPGVVLYAYLNLRNERLAVSAYFHGEAPLRIYHDLREHRDAIEAEVGAKLVWTHEPGRKSGEIVLRNPVDPTEEALWPSYYDWMRRSLETFRRVLGPRMPKDECPGSEDPGGAGGGLVGHRRARAGVLVGTARPAHRGRQPHEAPQAVAQHWTNFAVGRSGFYLSAGFVRTRREIGVWLILDGPHAKEHFHALAKDREAIEAELGTELEWRELPDKKQSNVVLRRSADPTGARTGPSSTRGFGTRWRRSTGSSGRGSRGWTPGWAI